MDRIKILIMNNVKQSELLLLDRLSACAGITPKNIFPFTGGAIVQVYSPEEIDKILEPDCILKLSELNLKPVIPPHYDPVRTIFVSNLPNAITSKNSNDIITEIHRCNELNVKKTYAIPSLLSNKRKLLKITFKTPNHAKEAASKGFGFFNLKVDPDFIKREAFEYVDQCYKCFRFDHITAKCSQNTYSCSKCSGPHHYKQCPNPTRLKCILCDGNHNAISQTCPVRLAHIHNLKINPSTPSTPSTHSNSSHFPTLPKPGPIPQPFTSKPSTSYSTAAKPSTSTFNPSTIPIHIPPPSGSSTTLPSPPPPPSNQIPPLIPPPPGYTDRTLHFQFPNQDKPKEWEVKLSIMKTFAEMVAKNEGDPLIFFEIMNEYVENLGFPPMPIPSCIQHRFNKLPPSNKSVNTSPPPKIKQIDRSMNTSPIQTPKHTITLSPETQNVLDDVLLGMSQPPPSLPPVINHPTPPHPYPSRSSSTSDPLNSYQQLSGQNYALSLPPNTCNIEDSIQPIPNTPSKYSMDSFKLSPSEETNLEEAANKCHLPSFSTQSTNSEHSQNMHELDSDTDSDLNNSKTPSNNIDNSDLESSIDSMADIEVDSNTNSPTVKNTSKTPVKDSKSHPSCSKNTSKPTITPNNYNLRNRQSDSEDEGSRSSSGTLKKPETKSKMQQILE